MRTAQKKFNRRITKAWKLGAASKMELELIARKKIQPIGDDVYLVSSLEAVRGKQQGERAYKGDYFKVEVIDGEPFPYPLKADFFEQNHRRLEGEDTFEQLPRRVLVWFAGDPIGEEMSFLINTGKLFITEHDEKNFFNAFIWGTMSVASKDDAVVFYSIKRNREGAIFSVDFNLVSHDIFYRDYELL